MAEKMTDAQIAEKLNRLPDELKDQVIDYIDFLVTKHDNGDNSNEGFKFDWEGALSELKDKYTSVELQHKALEWR